MSKQKYIRIATRKSPLALWQANSIREQLLAHWPSLKVELVPMSTSGDRFLNDKLLTVGGKGLFVKELEEALLDKRADLAVHSMKDVPVIFPEGLVLAGICARHNPFDAFVSVNYDSWHLLPDGAVVGTSSLRRQSQFLSLRPQLNVKPLRGNIHTRLDKMDSGEFDAIILAAAGLERMGLNARIRREFSADEMLPACGQGALGLECREGDEEIQALLRPLFDDLTARCVTAERRVNQLLGGNCHTPLAVFCHPVRDTHLLLRSKIASEDGQTVIMACHEGLIEDALLLAEDSVRSLLKDGAQDLLNGLMP